MKKLVAILWSKVAKIVYAVTIAVAVGGVAYFDTYPTYFKTEIVLTPDQCSEVATLLAASAFIFQNPGQALPAGAKAELDNVSRLSKRVANHILKKNPDLKDAPPMFLFMQLSMGCMAAEGKISLK